MSVALMEKEREIFITSCSAVVEYVLGDADQRSAFAAKCRAVHRTGVNVVEMVRIKVVGVNSGWVFRPIGHEFLTVEAAVQHSLEKCPCGNTDNNCATRRHIDAF